MKRKIISHFGELHRDTKSLGNSLTVFRVNLVEKLDHLLLNVSSGATEGTADVLNEVSSVSLGHDLSEQSSWLLEVSVGVLVGVSSSKAAHCELRLLLGGVLNWATDRVWLIVSGRALISIDGCGAISLMVGNSSSVGAINRDLVVVST